MRLIHAVGYDIRLQWRHGFYYAYTLICALYIVLLHVIPSEYQELSAVIITFSDPSMLGFIFIGGLVLLEKGQGILDPLFVTPFRLGEYIVSKTVSLSVLSLISSLTIHIALFGMGRLGPLYVLGVWLSSCFFTMLGLSFAVRCRTLNQFFLQSSIGSLIFMVPLLSWTGLYSGEWMSFLPTNASLRLIGSTFYSLSAWEATAAIVNLVLWCCVGFLWTLRSVRLFIRDRIGGASA